MDSYQDLKENNISVSVNGIEKSGEGSFKETLNPCSLIFNWNNFEKELASSIEEKSLF